VASALEVPVGSAAPPDHGDQRRKTRDGRDEPVLDVAQAEPFQDQRQKEQHGIQQADVGEIDRGEKQHARINQRLKHRIALALFALGPFGGETFRELFTLGRGQPLCLRGPSCR
jgi:hypothetical protein